MTSDPMLPWDMGLKGTWILSFQGGSSQNLGTPVTPDPPGRYMCLVLRGCPPGPLSPLGDFPERSLATGRAGTSHIS